MDSIESIVLNATSASTDLATIFGAMLSRIVIDGGLRGATLCLSQGALRSSAGEEQPAAAAFVESETDAHFLKVTARGARADAGWTRAAASSDGGNGGVGDALSAPILLAGRKLGDLTLDLPARDGNLTRATALTSKIAGHCARLLQRHDIRCWTAARLGRPWLPAGMSPEICDLDAFIEQAAASHLPVLLNGEFGTETHLIAAALHACSRRRDGPLVAVGGAHPDGSPMEWLARAAGGTLIVTDIDALPIAWQDRLARTLDVLPMTDSAADPDSSANPRPVARIVATTTSDLAERVRAGSFSRQLFSALTYLTAAVPPLRARLADMGALLAATLDRHGYGPGRKLDEAAAALFHRYSWPDNWVELDRAIARLAVLTTGPIIGPDDVTRLAPSLAAAAPPPPAEERIRLLKIVSPAPDDDLVPPIRATTSRSPDDWVELALSLDPAALAPLHPGLRRALTYLGTAYSEPVSLDDVAKAAYFSPSHLVFLFRTELGLSAKTLLTRIRIRRAQQLMRSQQRLPITEIALQVGFLDLSHFERTFRRLVGQSPREYRRDGQSVAAAPA